MCAPGNGLVLMSRQGCRTCESISGTKPQGCTPETWEGVGQDLTYKTELRNTSECTPKAGLNDRGWCHP